MCMLFVRIYGSIVFLGIMPLLNLKYYPKWMTLLKQFVIATPVKLLNRISFKFVFKVDILCTFAYYRKFWFNFFWENIELQPNILFCAICVTPIKHVYVNLNDREAVRVCFWQWMSKCYANVTIIYGLWVHVSNYYIFLIVFFWFDCAIGNAGRCDLLRQALPSSVQA